MKHSYSYLLTSEGTKSVEPATLTVSEQKNFLGIFSAHTFDTVFFITLLYQKFPFLTELEGKWIIMENLWQKDEEENKWGS